MYPNFIFISTVADIHHYPFDFHILSNSTPGLLATDIHIQILIILPMTISD